MAQGGKLNRREFLIVSGSAGLTLAFNIYPSSDARASASWPINAWLSIDEAGVVTILCPGAEMGQGVHSTLPAIVAEELKVGWEQVRVEFAPGDHVFANPLLGLHATFNSASVRGYFDQLRRVGAAARDMLRSAAAGRWSVPLEECVAVDGCVVHTPSGRRLGYGSVAADAAMLEPPADAVLSSREDWSLLGRPLPRKDARGKSDGTAVFGIDVHIDGMLVGTVAASPVHGGTLKTIDPAPALAVEGVRKVVRLPDAVIVLADYYWAAKQGLDRLEPVWDSGRGEVLDDDTIGAALTTALEQDAIVVAETNNPLDLLEAGQSDVVKAEYSVPYLPHLTMEPMNATAHVRKDGVEIWAPTQSPGIVRFAVAGALQIDPGSIVVHPTFLGGGFGRRSEMDFVLHAVQASKSAGSPVQIIWSREEDTKHDFYRPRAVASLAAKLSEDGDVQAWHARYACQSIMARVLPKAVESGIDDTSLEGALHLPYRFGSERNDYALVDVGLPVGFWRSPGHSQNAFFTESFIDELAYRAGRDAVEFRRRLLGERPRHRRVLDRAAGMIGWREPANAGEYRGIALHESHGSIVAEAVEISWSRDRKLHIQRISCVVDCGIALNPDTIEAQMESGIVYGLSAAMWGEINVESGRVKQSNFDDVRVLRMNEMPRVDVEIIEGGGAPGGIGEPSTSPIAPALASAIFAATGERIRSLPFARHGIELV